MDLSRHRRILSNVSRGEKLREVWIIVESSRPRKIDFPRTHNYLHRFSRYIKWLFARQCIWFISLVILVNKGDSSRPAPTRVHVPLDPVVNQIWWNIVKGWVKKRFSVKDRGSNKTVGKTERISRCIRRVHLISGWDKRFSNLQN